MPRSVGKGSYEHPSGAENVDFNTSHITPAVSELTMEYDIMPANSGLTSDDVLALKLKSCSMKNFGVKLMRERFIKVKAIDVSILRDFSQGFFNYATCLLCLLFNFTVFKHCKSAKCFGCII